MINVIYHAAYFYKNYFFLRSKDLPKFDTFNEIRSLSNLIIKMYLNSYCDK